MAGGEARDESFGEHGLGVLDPLLAALRRRQVLPHIPKQGVVVDLGCGYDGTFLKRLSPSIREGIGFDLSVSSTPPAANVRLSELAVDGGLPLEDASVDLISCLAVIEHVQRPDMLLSEALRILRPGAVLVVTTPAQAAKPLLELISRRLRLIDPAEIDDHERYYTRESLRRALQQAGFAPDRIKVGRFELGLNLVATAYASTPERT
jgi:SAM-dependent methyltransferase